MLAIFEMESLKLFAGLALNLSLSDLCLLHSWDYRHEPSSPANTAIPDQHSGGTIPQHGISQNDYCEEKKPDKSSDIRILAIKLENTNSSLLREDRSVI
jgi:hypothetical protein